MQPILVDLSGIGGGGTAGGTTINQDTVLYEAIKRFRDSQQTGGPAVAGATQLINELKLGTAADSDINAELMKKFVTCSFFS